MSAEIAPDEVWHTDVMRPARRARPVEWPLVGRDDTVAAIDAALAGSRAVLVSGHEGVGKTRLLSAIAARASERGCRVDQATGSAATRSIPFGALAHLVPTPAVAGHRTGILPALLGVLTDRYGRRESLLVVDDAHLLDPGAATLVAHLARSGDGPALAIGVRAGEEVHDVITGLWKDGVADRVDLPPLDSDSVAQLLRAVLGGPVDRSTSHRLHAVTQGNALYLRELIQEGRKRAAFERVNEVWRWGGEVPLSPALSELIEARLDQLDPDQRAALEAVAFGEPIAFDALERVVDPAVLDMLEEQSLLVGTTEGPEALARVSHSLYAEVLRRRAPRRRSRRLQIALADAIDAGDGDLLRSTALRMEAGAPPDAPRLIAAAGRASMLGDTALVRRLASAALSDGPHLEAQHLLATAAGHEGRWEEALDLWQHVLAAGPDDDLHASVAIAAGLALAMPLARPDDAVSVLAAAEAAIVGERQRSRVTATRVALFGEVAAKAAQHAPGTSDPATFDDAQIWGWMAASVVRLRRGEFDALVDESGPLLEIAARRDDWMTSLYVGLCRFFGYLLAGRMNECEAFCQASYQRTLDDPLPFARATWAHALGKTALHSGRLEIARANLNESIALLQPNDNGTLRLVLHELALTEALAGDGPRARALLGEADAAARGLQEPFVEASRIDAAICAGSGRVAEARALSLDAARRARAEDDPFYEIPALHDAARYGGAVLVAERLGELSHTFDGVVVTLHAEQAHALASDAAARLIAVADRYADVGLFLDAAESAGAAESIARSHDEQALATRAGILQQSMMSQCGRARPRTALVGGSALRTSLTERELQVAELTGRGYTDAEIAARLFVSVRTVNAHLRSIYAKLGLRGRRELRSALEGGVSRSQ